MRKAWLLLLFATLATLVTAAPGDRLTKVTTARPCVENRLQKDTKPQKVSRKDIDYEAIEWKALGEGLFKDPIMCAMYTGIEEDPIDVTIEVAVDNENIYRVANPWPKMLKGKPHYMIIDATDPDRVIVPYQNTTLVDYLDGITYIASYRVAAEAVGEDPDAHPELEITMKNGVINFPGQSVLFRWPEAVKGGDTDPSTYYVGDAIDGFLILPGGEYESEWEDVGVGKMVDCVFASILTGDLYPEPYDVIVQKSKKKEGMYLVLNPWQNLSTKSNPLKIDATDPLCVVIKEQYTGIDDPSVGRIFVKSPSSNASSSDAFLSSPDGDRNITFIGNRFNFANKSLYAYLPDYDVAHIFTTQIYEKSYLQLPDNTGISDAEANPNAPVEYYNLQGIKVSEPTQGVYIRRQGSSATKIVIR